MLKTEKTIILIAEQFVDLVLKNNDWGQIKQLSNDEIQTFFEIVSAAGFEPKSVVPGKLKGHYLEQDGSRTSETYPINSLCPFKVISQEGDDHGFATGWLDCALHHVVSGATQKGENRQQLIEKICSEIKRSISLQPIQLTLEGDLLREYPPSLHGGYFVDHTRDTNNLGSCVGVHMYCGGWMDRNRATKTCDAITCRHCHLRVLFPKEVKTYGELRQALASTSTPVPA